MPRKSGVWGGVGGQIDNDWRNCTVVIARGMACSNRGLRSVRMATRIALIADVEDFRLPVSDVPQPRAVPN